MNVSGNVNLVVVGADGAVATELAKFTLPVTVLNPVAPGSPSPPAAPSAAKLANIDGVENEPNVPFTEVL